MRSYLFHTNDFQHDHTRLVSLKYRHNVIQLENIILTLGPDFFSESYFCPENMLIIAQSISVSDFRGRRRKKKENCFDLIDFLKRSRNPTLKTADLKEDRAASVGGLGETSLAFIYICIAETRISTTCGLLLIIILFKPHSNTYKVDIIISMIQIRELKLRKVK